MVNIFLALYGNFSFFWDAFDALIREAQKALSDVFGYGLVVGSMCKELVFSDLSKDTQYYVVNKLGATTEVQNVSTAAISDEIVVGGKRKWQNEIAKRSHEAAYIGFVFAVSHALWCSPGHIASDTQLLEHIRRIDNRFPATLDSHGEGSSAQWTAAVPELGMGFLQLIDRMRSEGYIMRVTDSDPRKEALLSNQDNDERKQHVYELGSRFYAEVCDFCVF